MQKSTWWQNPIIWIFGVCLVLQIIGMISGESFVYDNLGIDSRTWYKEPWTLITSMFAHDPRSIWHFLFNMLTLYFLGTSLLRMIGTKRFLIVYFLAGIVGNLIFVGIASIMDDWLVAVGASGAIFGVGAALAVLDPMSKVMIFPFPFAIPIWVAIVILLIVVSFGANVAWQAHLGGAIAGAAYALYLRQVTFKHYYRSRRP